MKHEIILVHFGELWLKGGNRRFFVEKLYSNILGALRKEKYDRLENDRDRFVLHLSAKSDYDSIMGKLSKVFGISWFGGCITVKSEFKSIVDGIIKSSRGRQVRIEMHRSYKQLPFKSYEVVSELIKLSKRKDKKISLDVDSSNLVYVTAKRDFTYICADRRVGAQGLPVASSGKAVILLSGGIDSPVASYYAMKRGLEPIYLHIHGFPTADKKKLKKVYAVLDSLSGYSKNATMYFAPFHIFQGHSMKVPRSYELVLFKRFLYLLAEKISYDENADCIVTGESLGQVASQTMGNLKASSSGVDQIILRPLIGMDKQEIIDKAKVIGTFDASISDYKDVCSISIKGAELRAGVNKVDALAKSMKIDAVVRETIKKSKRESRRP